MDKAFTFTRIPRLVFGPGRLNTLPETAASFGRNVLLISGAHSFKQSGRLDRLLESFRQSGCSVHTLSVAGEPSPRIVDDAAAEFSGREIQVVIAVGGGSVMDAGKAVAAMMGLSQPVKRYLEGVGTESHPGFTLPLIAVPTTAGTGSEATKNAVLSETGSDGYKKSLRHDNFVPHTALLDPELTLSCPPAVTAACGMDAFTQLLEAYVSTKSSPLTDVLAFDGLTRVRDSLVSACGEGAEDISVRGDLAYAAFLSGIALAQAGLGTVHGLAAAMGGLTNMPHGAACGTLLAPVNKVTIDALLEEASPRSEAVLDKFARVGRLFVPDAKESKEACRQLVEKLYQWTDELSVPRLGECGISEKDIDKIAEKSSNKNNPVQLTKDQMKGVLRERL
jgi:alcohol dehydrogenase class IV